MKRWAILFTLLALSPAHADEAVQKVLDCMQANVPSTVRVRDVELITTDRAGGSRTLKGKLFARREPTPSGRNLVRAMLRVSSPPPLSGAAYLVRQSEDYLRDGMFVFLPSVKRVRQVTGTFADGALLGTHFSYNDFKQLESAFGGVPATLDPPGEAEGRPTYVLALKSVPEEGARYSAVRLWVDQKTCVPLKAEFYEGQTARKQLIAPVAGLRESNKHWYPSELEMRDLKDGSKTLLRVIQLTSDAQLPSRYFDPVLFYQGN